MCGRRKSGRAASQATRCQDQPWQSRNPNPLDPPNPPDRPDPLGFAQEFENAETQKIQMVQI